MKKQDVAGIIVYLIILAMAAVFGLVVIRQYSGQSGMETWEFILFIAGAIVAGIVANATIYELAHIIGAKIGGYKITSVAILGFVFSKAENKTKFHFGSYDGLTGETKIIPNIKRKKPSNPLPYLIMGTAFYAIEVIAIVFAFSILTREGSSRTMNNIAYFLLIFLAVGGVIVFYNIIPFQLDSMTDGYRLRLVSGKKNREAFNKMLLGETAQTPQEEKEQEEKATSFSGDLKLNEVFVCLDEENYIEAENLVDSVLNASTENKKISHKTLLEARSLKIILTLINKSYDEGIKFLDNYLSLHDKKQLSEENGLIHLGAYVLVASLLDRSHSECTRTLDRVYKCYKRTPENRRVIESKIFNKSLNLVIEKKPDWNLGEYLINLE